MTHVLQRMTAPLGQRNFRLLWIGQAVSALGDPLQAVALAWWILDVTGSPVVLSTALLALTVPRAMLTLVGGVVTDRLDARTVMFWSDAVRAATIGIFAACVYSGVLPLWFLYVLLGIQGAASGIFHPAAYSIAPRLVATEHLQAANSLSQTMPQLAMVFMAPLAGVLVAVLGPAVVLALNATSFAVAAMTAIAICPGSRPSQTTEASSLLDDIRIGVTYIWQQSWLVALLLVDVVLSIATAGPLAVGLPLLARNHGAGPEKFGLLLAGFGAGSIIGMLVLASRRPVQRRGRTFCILQLVQAPLLAALPFVPLSLAVVCLALIGFLNSMAVVTYLGLIQSRVAEHMIGRVMSFVALAAFGLTPCSQLLTGLAAETAGVTTVFMSAGGLLFAGAVGGLLTRSLRVVK